MEMILVELLKYGLPFLAVTGAGYFWFKQQQKQAFNKGIDLQSAASQKEARLAEDNLRGLSIQVSQEEAQRIEEAKERLRQASELTRRRSTAENRKRLDDLVREAAELRRKLLK